MYISLFPRNKSRRNIRPVQVIGPIASLSRLLAILFPLRFSARTVVTLLHRFNTVSASSHISAQSIIASLIISIVRDVSHVNYPSIYLD